MRIFVSHTHLFPAVLCLLCGGVLLRQRSREEYLGPLGPSSRVPHRKVLRRSQTQVRRGFELSSCSADNVLENSQLRGWRAEQYRDPRTFHIIRLNASDTDVLTHELWSVTQ